MLRRATTFLHASTAVACTTRISIKSQVRFRRRTRPDLDVFGKDEKGFDKAIPGEAKRKELAEDEEKFKKMREELDRKMARIDKKGGSQLFNDKTMYSAPPAEETKRSIDREMNLLKSGAELGENDNLYYIGRTKVPDHLEHWLMDPMGLKNPRDNKIVKKLQSMKLKQAKKHIKGNRKDSPGAVTQRMARIQSMLLREMNTILSDLPTTLAAGGARSFAPDEQHAGVISSSLVHITRVEVTRDLLQARFYWDCVPGQRPAVERELRRVTPQLRYMLQQQVQMKYAPDIHFMVDKPTLLEDDVERRLDIVEDELSRSGMLLSDDRIDLADDKSPLKLAKQSGTPALGPGIPDPRLEEFDQEEEAPESEETVESIEDIQKRHKENQESQQQQQQQAAKRERKFFGPQKPFDFRNKARQLIETYDGPLSKSRRYL